MRSISILLVAGALSIPVTVVDAQAPTQPPAAPTPMELFAKLLPVIRHDRCSNCHGNVDPITGRNHEGGDQTLADCVGCHNTVQGREDRAHPFWELPEAAHFFVGKSDRELCGQFSEIASKMGHELFISNHLRGDKLIIAAFEGMSAGAREEPPHPPGMMDQDEFIRLARDWLSRGHGACDVEGTVSLVETVRSEDRWHLVPNSDDFTGQLGTRNVTVTYSGGRYRAQIDVSGTITEDHVQHLSLPSGNCDLSMHEVVTYSGTTTGPATVTASYGAFFGDTDPTLGQTDYRIDVTLPPERTQRTRIVEITDGCGTGVFPSTPLETLQLNWPASSFTLEGHLDDPKTVNLVGFCDREVRKSQVRETKSILEMSCNRFGDKGNAKEPWLMNQMLLGMTNLQDIPVRVRSYWNIHYGK